MLARETRRIGAYKPLLNSPSLPLSLSLSRALPPPPPLSLSLTPEMRYPTTYFTPYDKQHQIIRIIVPLNSQLTPTKCVMIPVLDLGSGVIFSALLQFGIRIQIQQKEEPKQ